MRKSKKRKSADTYKLMSREMKKVKEKFLKLNPFGLLSCILSVRRFTHGRR